MERLSVSPQQFEVRAAPNAEEAVRQATLALHDSLQKAKASKKSVLLLLSGGSAQRLLEEAINRDVLPDDTTIAVLDERFSRDPGVNNFLQIRKTAFFQSAVALGAKYIDTVPQRGELWHPFSQRYDAAIKEWVEKHAGDGEIIATLGVGEQEDHTAGMFPGKRFKSKFMQQDTLMRGHILPHDVNIYTTRVTATVPLIEKIHMGIALAIGSGKRNILRQVMQNQTDEGIQEMIPRLPVASWRLTGHTKVFTDGAL